MTTVTAPAPVLPPRRRSKRWLRLVIPYAVVAFILVVSVLAYAIEEPDAEDPGFLSPVSSADIGSAELARQLRQRGVTIERHTRTADALRSAHRGDATLFVPTPDLLHTFYLRMLKLMPESTPVVLVRPGDDTLGRGLLAAKVTGNRWATTTALPGCGYRPAAEAGRAGVRRTAYAAAAPLDRCYGDSVLRMAHQGTAVTLVGSADPFRNDRIGEHGNARLAVGLLSGAPRVVWLDLHGEERGPRVLEETGFDPSPAPADLGRDGTPDPDFPVPDPEGTDGGAPPELGQPPEDGEGGSGPSTFDLFPATAWTVLALIAVAAVLAAAARARRLGAPVPEPLPVLVPTTETVTGRGRLYQRSRDRGAALAVLRRAARDRITHALDLPPDAERATLVPAVVAQMASSPPSATSPLLPDSDQVDTALFGPDPETDDDLVHLATALDLIVDAVTRIPEGETRD